MELTIDEINNIKETLEKVWDNAQEIVKNMEQILKK